MAKWDLSKLPEGRKPLPDEWFAERAQMQDRIKGLEANLAKAVEIAELFSRGVEYDYHGNIIGDEERRAMVELEELTGETMTDEDYEKIIDELEDEIADLKAKLSKAVGEMRKVDEYLTRLQTPNTEPLNSVNSCGSKELRGQYTAAVRNEAREYWASLGNTIAELTGGKDE